MIWRVTGAAVVLALAATLADAQTPPRDARAANAAPVGTGAIKGVVTTADSNARSLRLVYVVIIGAMTGTLRVTSTDNEGRFSVSGLPADRYVIGASKPPYLGAVAGARRPARAGTPVVLAEGQTIENVAVRLPPGAAITGVIIDERGEPAANVAVGLQQSRLQGTERTFVTVSSATTATDDRGRYRLFSLPPGEYVVVASSGAGAIPRTLTDAEVDAAIKGTRPASAPTTSTEPVPRYSPVFFPGTTRATDATPVVLSAGEERQSVDFRLELVRTARVEGIVMTSDGQPTAVASLVMAPASQNSMMRVAFGAQLSTDGRFTISGVPPGAYTITARAMGAQAAGQFAIAQVDVSGADQTGLQLTLQPPLTFAGRIAFEGATPAPALAGRRISMRALTTGLSATAAPAISVTGADGTFTVTNVSPGRYLIGGPLFFGATSDSVTWAMQSVLVDGRDVTDLPIDIAPDALPKSVVVTFVDRTQEVSGRLIQSSGTAGVDYTLVLFPSDKRYWISGSRRILTTRPGTDGQFAFGGTGPTALPPGDYLLAVVTDIDRDEQFDPALLSSLLPGATAVTLQAGEQKVQEVRIK